MVGTVLAAVEELGLWVARWISSVIFLGFIQIWGAAGWGTALLLIHLIVHKAPPSLGWLRRPLNLWIDSKAGARHPGAEPAPAVLPDVEEATSIPQRMVEQSKLSLLTRIMTWLLCHWSAGWRCDAVSSWLPLRLSFPKFTNRTSVATQISRVWTRHPQFLGSFTNHAQRFLHFCRRCVCWGVRGDPPKRPTCRATQMKEVLLWTLSGNPDNLLIFFSFFVCFRLHKLSSKWKWVFYWAAVERRNIVGEKTIIKRRKTFFYGWKAEPRIQEMDPKSRGVPYRKCEVAGLQIIKHANLKKPTLRGYIHESH